MPIIGPGCTLVIRGSRDILPEAFADRASDLIANSQLLEMDAGHFIPIERALEVSQSLYAYFRSSGAKTATISGSSYKRTSRKVAAKVDLIPVPATPQ